MYQYVCLVIHSCIFLSGTYHNDSAMFLAHVQTKKKSINKPFRGKHTDFCDAITTASHERSSKYKYKISYVERTLQTFPMCCELENNANYQKLNE